MTRTNSKQKQRERQAAAKQLANRKDGFRPRRIRPKNWLAGAIKRGEVRDPNVPFEEPQEYPGAVVVNPPIATAAGEGTKE